MIKDSKSIEPGDRIIITRGIYYMQIYIISELTYYSNKKLYRFESDEGKIVWCSKNAFKIIEPSNVVPIPGDQIIITDNIFGLDKRKMLSKLIGRELVVVESPYCPSSLNDISECIWCADSNGSAFRLTHKNYETIKRLLCTDCGGTGKITLFTSIVKCDCQIEMGNQ